jgi:signal transduction histidine kinase
MSAQPKILIVEDEGIVAFNLQQRLQQMGYQVTGLAESGSEGLSLVSSQRPDLVLMDIHIKGEMDGIELARMLTREHALPIIYLTAYSEDTTLERARQTQPYGYLIKPFSERELHATIQMALERHQVQTALRDSQLLLNQALDAALMGTIEIDLAQDHVRMNGAPAATLGFVPGQAQTLDAFLAKLSAGDREQLREDLRPGVKRRHVLSLVSTEGREHWLQIDVTTTEDGRMRGVVQDVSTRERARLTLLRTNEQLEERVAERTAELRQHVQELEAFSHTAAHDLRSPIRAIAGLGEILMELHGEQLGDDGRQMLDRMRQAARRMGELIEALLGLSKLSRAPLHPQPVDLAVMAREIGEALRQAEPGRAVDIDTPDSVIATADPALIRSVLDNLLRNAWKFSRERERAQIRFSVEDVDGEPVYAVSDNGCGFDMKHGDQLFSPFFRLHSEQAYGGTGLGLSIAQRIVARHGGRIWAEGRPDEGATIRFTLGA